NYDSVTRLYLFKWLYLYNDSPKVTRYKDLILNKKIIEYHTVTVAATKKIGQTRYILDMDLFRYLIKDLIYFRNIGLIDREEVRIIQEDLLKLLGDMEELCLTGVYKETGNKVQFYISNINLNASYKYIQTTTYFISFIKAFTMNAVVSFDKKSMLSVKSWLQSLIKSSTLITESGEIDRIHFFHTQRELVEAIQID
ncbi:MAG: hypothetical protein LUJ25_06235, partial [Firmicutes bacterium]|nr:hypothetical protein [Bacillota bacterium]